MALENEQIPEHLDQDEQLSIEIDKLLSDHDDELPDEKPSNSKTGGLVKPSAEPDVESSAEPCANPSDMKQNANSIYSEMNFISNYHSDSFENV